MRYGKLLCLLLLISVLIVLFVGCDSTAPSPSASVAPASAVPTAETSPATVAPTADSVSDPADRPAPVDPEDAELSDEEFHCTISISCVTILDNMDKCKKEKRELVPEDGWLLEPTEVVFYGGESVFNVLQRTCRQKKIHMEFADTPLYGSIYIEGIGNLYEQDVGELSGWMYSVNGWFPNYGSSRYALKDGDVIQFVYTCDLGADVGDEYIAQDGE